jgi:hypothetical protein
MLTIRMMNYEKNVNVLFVIFFNCDTVGLKFKRRSNENML